MVPLVEEVARLGVGDRVCGHPGIVVDDVLLTCHTVAGAQLEVGKCVLVAEPGLVDQTPCERHGGEEAPAVLLGESRRCVGTEGRGQKEAGVEAVVHASVERYEIVFRLIVLRGVELVALGVVLGEVVLLPEMLPAVTGHSGEVMLIAPGMLVVGVEVKQVVALLLAACLVETCTVFLVAGVHHAGEFGHEAVVVAVEHVVTEVEVEREVLETVYLIVELSVAYRTEHFVDAVVKVKHSDGVVGLDGHGGVAVHPDVVTEAGACGVVRADGAGGIIADGVADNRAVHLTLAFP